MHLLKFNPSYEERIWGGRSFRELFGRNIPKGVRIGESLEIYDSPKGSSIVSEGEFKGSSLRELIQKFPTQIMGNNWTADKLFPIIVKLLDARQRLSLQVHPDEFAEKKYGKPRKNEAWYFLNCGVRSGFISGLKKNVTPEILRASVNSQNIENLLEFRNSHIGDFLFIREGIVHLLGSDNIVLEIQENSDSTYRLNDWNRLDASGNSRELHIEEAIDSIDFANPSVEPILENDSAERILCNHKSFKMVRFLMNAGERLLLKQNISPKIISLVSGELDCSGVALSGVQSALAPFCAEILICAKKDSLFLITENFSNLKHE